MTQLELELFEPTTRHPQSRCDGTCLTHVMMPNMAYACGETILTVRGHFEMGTSNFDKVTCPGCREEGADQIHLRMRRQTERCVVCNEKATAGDWCKGCAR